MRTKTLYKRDAEKVGISRFPNFTSREAFLV